MTFTDFMEFVDLFETMRSSFLSDPAQARLTMADLEARHPKLVAMWQKSCEQSGVPWWNIMRAECQSECEEVHLLHGWNVLTCLTAEEGMTVEDFFLN